MKTLDEKRNELDAKYSDALSRLNMILYDNGLDTGIMYELLNLKYEVAKNEYARGVAVVKECYNLPT